MVLDGAFQLNDCNTSPVEQDTRRILRICGRSLSVLAVIRYGKVPLGLRPYRDARRRLEHEKTINGLDVIHCYGNFGSGIGWVVFAVRKMNSPYDSVTSQCIDHKNIHWKKIFVL